MSIASSCVDLIVTNGCLYTQDSRRPQARAAAIGGGRIVAVGDDDSVLGLAGAETEVLDLGGRAVLPGFQDSHFHYHEWALGLRRLMLADAGSLADLLERVRQAAAGTGSGQWITGQGWNEADWVEPRMPSRHDLDRAAPEHPVMLYRSDLHLVAVNTRALRMAGIDRNTPDPPQGLIERDETGRATGILKDLAINLVKEKIPSATRQETLDAMAAGIPLLHRLGITGVHDFRLMGGMEGAAAFSAWQQLDRSGRLQLRAWVLLPGEFLDEIVRVGLRTGFGNERLQVGHLKYFTDGGMGARSAWMLEPYLDAASGMPLLPVEQLEKAVIRAQRHGLAVAVHAIGDRANRELVRMFERIDGLDRGPAAGPDAGPPARIPHRIEHVQMIRPEDLKRMARLALVPSVQPPHIVDDMTMIDRAVGQRGAWVYPFGDMLAEGLEMICGSDCPVADPNPLLGIEAAVTRKRRNGYPDGGWYPRQRLTVAQAVRAYTLAPALACGRGHQLGSLTEGKLADLVVLDQDPFRVDPDRIGDIRVDMTLFDGRRVYGR